MAIGPFPKMSPKEMAEMVKSVREIQVSVIRLFETIPFDGIPGGDLSYTHKKKDDDND